LANSTPTICRPDAGAYFRAVESPDAGKDWDKGDHDADKDRGDKEKDKDRD